MCIRDRPTDGSPGRIADLCGLPLYSGRADIRNPPSLIQMGSAFGYLYRHCRNRLLLPFLGNRLASDDSCQHGNSHYCVRDRGDRVYCVCGFSERAIRLAPDAGRGFGSAWRRRPLYQVGMSLAHAGWSVRLRWQLSARER